MNSSEITDQIYERVSFGGRLILGQNPAVLVVDFTKGFTDPACAFGWDYTAEVEATRRVLDVARERGHLVLYTTVGYDPTFRDAVVPLQKAPRGTELVAGTPWGEIDPRLGRREDEPIVHKTAPSALFGTRTMTILVSSQIDTVILCGAVTSGCVRGDLRRSILVWVPDARSAGLRWRSGSRSP